MSTTTSQENPPTDSAANNDSGGYTKGLEITLAIGSTILAFAGGRCIIQERKKRMRNNSNITV